MRETTPTTQTVKNSDAAPGSARSVKLAPAIGAMIARELVGPVRDFDTTVPLSFLCVDRQPIELASKSVLA